MKARRSAKNSAGRYFLRAFVCVLILATLLACNRIKELRAGTAPNATTPALSPNTYVPGDYVETINSSGLTRTYRLHIPPRYQQGKPTAIVINLHGFSSNAAQQERISNMSAKADQAGFIAVHPEGTGKPQEWRFGPGQGGQEELQFFRDLINTLSSKLSIDANRIYATGISNGAQMTNRLGCALSHTFAAIAPISGGYFRGEECNTIRPLPVIAFHGTADNLLPYDGHPPLMLSIPEWAANWATRNGCNATPQVTSQKGKVTGETWGGCKNDAAVVLYTVNGGGHSWPGSDLMPASITTHDIDATDMLWDFFAAHPK